MSDEEEILFDDIYEVASHCQHFYFIVTINSFIVVIVFIIIFGNTKKVNLLSTPNIVIINQSIYDTYECVGVGSYNGDDNGDDDADDNGDDDDDDDDNDEAFQSTHDPDRPNYITACSDVPI